VARKCQAATAAAAKLVWAQQDEFGDWAGDGERMS